MGKKKYEVVLTPEAQEQLNALPKEIRDKMKERFDQIAERGISKDAIDVESTKPCPVCNTHFFHSDGYCPCCLFKVV
jgi:mRNA-degrading endonuclease RelE of RelBE toxin-antitoxin system